MKARVLIVEDNEDLAENLAELFDDAGATVRTVATAVSAERAALEHTYDLAVVDLGLPAGASGVELLPRLRSASPDGEIVLMTGNASLDTAIEAVRQGVFAYVLKPFDPSDLLAVAERALSQVALRRERETLARELAHSEAVHRGVVETVNALIVGIGAENVVELANPCAAETLGWPGDDARGRPFLDVAVDGDAHDRLAAALDAARAGEPSAEIELAVRGAAGVPRIVRWHVLPLGTQRGADALLLAVGQDVTERLELERRTARAEALSTIGALTTGLAHEIRNPLNAATLQLELLARSTAKIEDRELAGQSANRVAIVKQELGRLTGLLDEFLELARPRDIVREPFEIDSLLAEVAALQAPLAEAIGVEIVVDARETCTVLGERAKVVQVVVNLVNNALEALRSQRGGHIALRARVDGDELARIEVEDSGPGLAPEVAHTLFDPFVTTKQAGTGLGLAIVKKIVELHGGEVGIEPASPRGARAWFTLSRSPTPASGTGSSAG